MTDEKILKKVGKLLKLYGVSDEEKEKFILDLQDKKYDDQEEVEEVVEEKPTEEFKEEEKVEEVGEEEQPLVEEEPAEEPAQPVEEQQEEDLPVEQPEMEQPPVDQPQPELPTEQPQPVEQLDARFEEIKKTLEGFDARLKAFEDLAGKLAIPENTDIGLPANNEGANVGESSFDDFNRKRMGR